MRKENLLGRLWGHSWFRDLTYLAAVIAVWQILYGLRVFPAMLFPSMWDILKTLLHETLNGGMVVKTAFSLKLIAIGMGVSVALAAVLTAASMSSKAVMDLVSTLIAVLDPLPGIAILPVAILVFGLGEDAIIFVMIHSIVWPMLLNITGGFKSVPAIYTDVGRNIGLRRGRLLWGVYIPASVPSILAGFKTGWSRAWRAFISAEMVFGASGTSGGLGWDIYMKKAYLDMDGMYATLIVIMLIGILIEKGVFRTIENATVKKWGMAV
jgi:NitT/TauT family transport system permease protein